MLENTQQTNGLAMHKEHKIFKEASLYIQNWLEHQPGVKEESITDWLLFDISKQIKSVHYKSFSRHEEARKTGADWEWWLVFKDFSLRLRIQAKKIKISSDNYSAIAYTNRHGLQIEKLLLDSVKDNFIPLYAFYTPKASTTMCGANILDEGVYLAGGKTIFESFVLKGKKTVSDNDILKLSNPLSCLLGCHKSFFNGGRLTDYFKSYYAKDVSPDNSEKINSNQHPNEMLGFHKKMPNHISSFIKHSIEGLPDRWEKEFGYQLEGINSLMVYDLRNIE